MLRRLAAISLTLVFLLGAMPAGTARRPRYGGTLRVEIGASVASLDPAVPSANSEEATAKEEIGALLYGARSIGNKFAGAIAGSGPFRIAGWDPGNHATLAANDDYRGGRPFVDSIEITMGCTARDRLLDLELNKVDFAEIPAEQARRASEQGVRISASLPDELLAMVSVAGRPAMEDARVREAVARSIDRAAIVNFILQKEGEPAGGLLPQWSSGTAFLFSTAADIAGARQLRSQIAPSLRIVLGYDAGDLLGQTVAERIVVNAREAEIPVALRAIQSGRSLEANASANVDMRIVRLRMPSPHPRITIENFISVLGAMVGLDTAPLSDRASPEDVYSSERAAVSGFRVVPLVWLPQVYGLSGRVRDWKAPGAGENWPLADVWLEGSDGSSGSR